MELYIHFPFCKSKCCYCDFNSYACQSESTIFSYLTALNREIRFCAQVYGRAKIDTIYIGGGTPSMLPNKVIESVCRVLSECFDLSGLKEFSIECNPESIEEEKLKSYKAHGINRISIGVQSLLDENLKSMGRLHTSREAIEKVKLASSIFENVSCDLIVGLPYDTNESVRAQIETLAPLVKHISVYALSVEEGTPLKKRVDEGRICLPSDDEVADYLEISKFALKEQGYERYEVSNFARRGYECLHNVGYWTDEEYIGLGAGAHSYLKTKDGKTALASPIRFAEPKDINAYIAGVNCASSFDMIPRMEARVLSDVDIFNERVMLGLRTTKGVDGSLLEGAIPDEIGEFFTNKEGRTALTERGMEIMNSLLVRILRL